LEEFHGRYWPLKSINYTPTTPSVNYLNVSFSFTVNGDGQKCLFVLNENITEIAGAVEHS
jgi:hypothetical protein